MLIFLIIIKRFDRICVCLLYLHKSFQFETHFFVKLIVKHSDARPRHTNRDYSTASQEKKTKTTTSVDGGLASNVLDNRMNVYLVSGWTDMYVSGPSLS